MAKDQPLPPLPFLFCEAPLYVAYSLATRTPSVVAAEATLGRERAAQAAAMVMSDSPPPAAQSERERLLAAIQANLNAIDSYRGPMDAYCLGCSQPSVFHSAHQGILSDRLVASIRYRHFSCARNKQHGLFFALFAKGATIQKIGQLPSLADIGSGVLHKYRKALDQSLFSELHRAVGLCAHGVGVGSFVYLRRVFESLLEGAHRLAQQDPAWDEGAYQRQRVEERILALQHHLPPFLVENRGLYGILSKGIHELAEDECLAHFPVVRSGIELILDDVLARQEREERVRGAREAIARLTGELKKGEAREGK